ncbi:MAG: GspH/FimT family pseudopilin [Pseudomonadota bacterium]
MHKVKVGRARGFTLLEAVIVVVVIAIVTTLGGPSLFKFVEEHRLSSAANELASTISSARSSAISLKTHVAIEPVNNDWSQGWQVTLPSEQKVLATFPVHSTLSMTSSSTNDLVFNAGGTKNKLTKIQFKICSSESVGKEVVVSGVGATRIKPITNNCKQA